ncbi:phosphoinositide phosphatase SAC6-like [Cynara cardunculus var. scolymus]|uniref:phosphoinositide phosphatase SAC6-like n=1 Tax=Cynara cardunculus var. scolymus TaxID=59895 RepID=UPI000D629705|nr:phosphoinositide phosphatase SAC6-like [Cynara cardunculus var. scolymus]
MKKVDPSHKLYRRMRLWEFPDRYIVQPIDGSSGSWLAVSRDDGSTTLVDEFAQCAKHFVPKFQPIFGVIGMLKLLAGSYLLVISERKTVGTYLGHHIFKVVSLKVLPCDQSSRNSSKQEKKMESEFSNLLKVTEKTPGLYFSYDVNITLSTQCLNELDDESKLLPLWRQADSRFLWNTYLLEAFVDKKLDPYMLPIIQGSFQSFQSTIGLDIIDVILIARRCTRKKGTRLWRRGADSDGYVANFVESEQIIQLKGCTSSFVQVRGSIPFLWEQRVGLTLKSKFKILRHEEAAQVAERHFLGLRKKYGNVLAIDLVSKHGDEGKLSEKFATSVQNIVSDDMRYLHFDFHGICGHVHFERLSMLYAEIKDFLHKNSCYMLSEKGEKVERQVGIVRTNSIDCLDRTNVTQSMIGRKMLEFQLERLGVVEFTTQPDFEDCFKTIWANHGDDISIHYSGTPALKGDFVRFGKRTVQGILKDGWNALISYYLNNLVDNTKHDYIDLINPVSRTSKRWIKAIASFRLVLAVITMVFLFTMWMLM